MRGPEAATRGRRHRVALVTLSSEAFVAGHHVRRRQRRAPGKEARSP